MRALGEESNTKQEIRLDEVQDQNEHSLVMQRRGGTQREQGY